jgi:hypothetical protein
LESEQKGGGFLVQRLDLDLGPAANTEIGPHDIAAAGQGVSDSER